MKLAFNKNKQKKEPTPSETPPKPEPTPSVTPPKPEPTPSVTPPKPEPTEAIHKVQEVQAQSTISKNTNHDEDIKKLLNFMNQSKKNEITPSINFKDNRVSFPILTNVGLNEHDVKFLESLASESVGILEKSVYERQVVCPKHPDDLSAGIRLYCPQCSSMDVERLHLVEHKVCGFIAEKEKYGVDDVKHVQKCPHCKKQIDDYQKEIRLPGRWNKCHSCTKIFDNVLVKLHCRKFGHDFDVTEADSIPIPYYKLKENALENVGIMTIISPLKQILTSSGYAVEELAKVIGKSGVQHPVSIYAGKGNEKIAIFIESSKTQIHESEINSALVKVLDITPSKTILIAMPSISAEAQAMGEAHGMKIIAGDNNDNIVALFQSEFSKTSTIEESEPSLSSDGPKKIN